jgi:hypothetical protein
MKYIYLTNTDKNFIPTKTCHLLRIVGGFASILDGLITVFSFGYLSSEFTVTVVSKLLDRRIRYCGKGAEL